MKKDLSKDHPRNRLMDYYIPGASIYSRIVKVQHSPADFPSSSGSQDLEPFVMYSMNKHRRWELDPAKVNHTDVDGVKVVVVEREIDTCYSTWMCLGKHNFDEAFNCSRVVNPKTLHGVHNAENVVSYHIITVPAHFKKTFDKKCFRYIGLRYPEFLGYSSKDLRPIDYELLEYEKEQMDVEEDAAFDESESPEVAIQEPRHFYNLEDHIVTQKPKRKQ